MRLLDTEKLAFRVVRRTAEGTWRDGFIHAGNLAYLTLLALFPFFILGAALLALLGEPGAGEAMIRAIVSATPPSVASTIEPVAFEVMAARHGWLLWVGAAIALWTISSVIETLRDILHRAYGTRASQPFWKYRLGSIAMILVSVILLMISLFAQVAIGAAEQLILARLPQLGDAMAGLAASRAVPALFLFLSLWLLFFTLTPAPWRSHGEPVWPGALLVTTWWIGVTMALPPLLRSFFSYSLTYGSLAGIMITLFFFWLVGLGLVVGAELNAALAEGGTNDREGAGLRAK